MKMNTKALAMLFMVILSVPGEAFIPVQVGGCSSEICCENNFDRAIAACEASYYGEIATCAGALVGCGCTVAINPLIVPCAVACFTLGATCAAQIPRAWLNYQSCLNRALRDFRNCYEAVSDHC